MIKRGLVVFILVIFLLSVISHYYSEFLNTTGNAINQDFYVKETAILERVIDGDTIEARVGEELWKIRLLGINTPEKGKPYANNSKDFLKQFTNKTIYLLRDFEDTDKYNRKLRYVFYENRFLNLEILESGFANIYYYSGLNYEEELIRAENQARVNERGIWAKSSDSCANCIEFVELDPIKELFIIRNNCNYYCNLSGWFVKDSGRNIFLLDFLNSEEERIYNSSKEVWNNQGDRLFIFDEQGKLVLFYEYSS